VVAIEGMEALLERSGVGWHWGFPAFGSMVRKRELFSIRAASFGCPGTHCANS